MRLSPSLLAVGAACLACTTTPPYEPPFQATRLTLADGESIDVDHVVMLFDSSGSIDPQTEFPYEKQRLESFVAGMPDGDYEAGLVAFGGQSREGGNLQHFERDGLASEARTLRFLGEDTPLEQVLGEVSQELSESGTAAVVIVSDGIPTVRGTQVDAGPTLAAAQALVEGRNGRTCFHTVQVGDVQAGGELLQQIAGLTDCGSFRPSASIDSAGPLLAFQREIFVGEALSPVAARPAALDSDGDGVLDADDRCPGTPRGAQVDPRGCWATRTILFATDQAVVVSAYDPEIRDIARVLRENPDLRVRIDGYTDATGPEAYNQALSERRAEAVRTALEANGVDGSRLEVVGHGESNPVASNATREGRAENRRIEFTVLEGAGA